MSFSCFNCNTVTDFEVSFEVKTFVCPSCKTVYLQSEGQFKFKDKFEFVDKQLLFKIELGAKAILKGKEYQLSGVLIKQAHGNFYWREYILYNEALEFIFLSEADGHWMLLTEMEDDLAVHDHRKFISYDEMIFDLYEYYEADIVSAIGYFDFDVSRTKVQTAEYINPPFLISGEETDGDKATFYGEHISKRAVKKAFGIKDLPYQDGIGLVQPFIFNLRNLALIFCTVAILIVLTDWSLNNNRVEKEVINARIPFDSFNNKDYVSPSFELKGSAAPLSIFVSSGVDNSWANIQIALVNEKTGEETYANKDIEYYHGYTEGENWTEGSTSEDFNICGVSEGKYHLTLTPMKAPEDSMNSSIDVRASWHKPSYRNVWLTLIFMGVFIVLMYYLERYFETKRWEDSSYSPYNNE